MSEQWDEGQVFLLITDKNHASHVSAHTCWNKGRFVERQRVAHAKEGSTVAVVDKETYQRYRKGLH